MTDQEIIEYFESIIRPKIPKGHKFYKSQKERDNHVESVKSMIRDELMNIGVKSERIWFSFDGLNLDVVLSPKPRIIPFDVEIKFEV